MCRTSGPILVLLIALRTAGMCGVDFLVPGVSLASLSLEQGAEVTYLVVAEAFGESDSSFVGLKVLGGNEDFMDLEISVSSYPPSKEETVTVRFSLSRDFKEISSPDEYMSYCDNILLKEGEEGFREPTGEELEEMELEKVFFKSHEGMDREVLPPEEIEAPGGRFLCEVEKLARRIVKPVLLGGVKGEREESESVTLWHSSEVPFWGLVMSRLEREASTRIRSTRPTASKVPRRTKTYSLLLSCKRPSGE